ncbi:MAG: endo alpha-1,4 polygalactosaminidase, partial [Streptomycetaceae bacterium]|nr:endo alpha-1,4 polygalactosaminidase [Streptomycetaceae bacterium]
MPPSTLPPSSAPQEAPPGIAVGEPNPAGGAPAAWSAPQANAGFDYQIGGPYAPPAGVTVVVRDRGAQPWAGAYNVCYVNAFQAQPDTTGWWEATHPDLLLRDGGAVVMDEDWGEALLDVSTEAKRAALLGVVGPWIDECARRGFQAVEPDNLDSFGRSHGRLTLAHDAAFARLLAARAHAAGLALAQKNTAELLDQHAS